MKSTKEVALFVQVVTYSLEGISEDAYLDVATGVAPRYAGLPGLLAKVWLENPGGNRYGAVYFWEDAESMERFGNSDLFEGDTAEFGDFISEEFKVLENLTAITQPALEILEGRRTAPAATAGVPPPPKKAAAPPARTVKRAPPPPKKAGAATKGTSKAAKAPAPVKATGKAAPTKAAVKKAPAKKAPAEKAPAKKAPAKKAPAKKAPAKVATGKKAGKKAVR